MENSTLLIETIKRLEGKVDTMSTSLATNTEITKSHTGLLGEMKNVHDSNSTRIMNIENQMTRMESWKNGQTLYQVQTNESIKNITERLRPIEDDFVDRRKNNNEMKRSLKEIMWRGAERIILILAGAVLISWRTILDNLK